MANMTLTRPPRLTAPLLGNLAARIPQNPGMPIPPGPPAMMPPPSMPVQGLPPQLFPSSSPATMSAPGQRDTTNNMEAAYPAEDGMVEDYYPTSSAAHDELVAWCNSAFLAADKFRSGYVDKWQRYYQLYRSHVDRTVPTWKSRVFIPMCFWVIETVLPRLVANLPKFLVKPIGQEDVPVADTMEQLLEWATEQSRLFVQLAMGIKDALIFGTGILKTYQRLDVRKARRLVPLPPEPQTAMIDFPMTDPETGMPLTDPDGNPQFGSREVVVGYASPGNVWEPYEYVAYDGPAAEAIDLFDFWIAPEADTIQGARFVIHRTYREYAEVMQRVADGSYQLPPNWGPNDIAATPDEAQRLKLDTIDLGQSQGAGDNTRHPVEILEIWRKESNGGSSVITFCNRKSILRYHSNPFDHGEKPFIPLRDYVNPHEFFGSGEIEAIEGQQDIVNVMVNSRIDNLRLVLNKMFAVQLDSIVDRRDLVPRPGGIIRINKTGPVDPSRVLYPIEFGEITASAYQEVRETFNIVQEATGVNAYTQGQDNPDMNDTATGVSLLQDAAGNRFGLKTRLNELMGLTDLGRHFGSLIQQFTSSERIVRIMGPRGEFAFAQFSPETIMGALDYDIETSSSAQTDAARKRDALSLFNLLFEWLPPAGKMKLIEDVLTAFSKRDIGAYLEQMGMPGMLGMPMGAGAPGMMGGLGPPMAGAPALGGAGVPGQPPGAPGQFPGMPGSPPFPPMAAPGGSLTSSKPNRPVNLTRPPGR